MNSIFRKKLLFVVFSGMVALCLAASVNAGGPGEPGPIGQLKKFHVNVQSDKIDANIMDGICNAELDPMLPEACTLRAAIMQGNVFGEGWAVEVVLEPKLYVLAIPGKAEDSAMQGDLDINRSMRIGVPSGSLERAKIDASGLDRAFAFNSGADGSKLYGVEIVGGDRNMGSAVFSYVDSLVIENANIHSNSTASPGSVVSAFWSKSLIIRGSRIHHNGSAGLSRGDAIVLQGDASLLTIVNSSVDSNYGSGVVASNGDHVSVVNSTISTNAGDGLHLHEAIGVVRSATVVNNATEGGPQIRVSVDEGGYAELDLTNSIVSGLDGDACDIDASAENIAFYTLLNIYSDDTCDGEEEADGSLHNTVPDLSSLGEWGGSTPTHVPLPDSPAIDNAPASICEDDISDQRGEPRPVSFAKDEEPACDTGAVEVQPTQPLAPGIFADGFEGGG